MIHYVNNDSDLAAVSTSSGDTVLLKSGQTFLANVVPSSLMNVSNLTLGYFGGTVRPIITGGVTRSDWTFDAVNQVYWRQYASNICGNITEDGVPMRWVAWNTDIATTALSMTSTSLPGIYSGSFSFDYTAFILYIKPSSGTASEHLYVPSENLYCLMSSSTQSGLKIDGLELQSGSRHNLLMYNKPALQITNTITRFAGGIRAGTLYLGNGFELSYNTSGAYIDSCEWYDTFDSGTTSQLYEATPKRLSDHVYYKCKAARHGMHGIEISTHKPNNDLYNIVVEDFEDSLCSKGEYSWAGDRNGSSVTLISTDVTSTGGKITGCHIGNVSTNQARRSILSYQTRGINAFQNCTGTACDSRNLSNRGSVALNVDNSYPQADLVYNVSDNFGGMIDGGVITMSSPIDRNTSWVL